MVHRVQKVVPDLDDRLTPPDAARESKNMRFAASIGDTNLSMNLVNGMAQLTFNYTPPEGDNQVIGVKEDFESQAVFFALWNSNNNHGIYRILNGVVDLVIGGSILNFQEDSDVSIAVIDGKIFWTDDHSQPKMVNIAKGIANGYPSPLEEWMITQIKRPPGLPLNITVDKGSGYVSTDFFLNEASIDYSNLFPNANGFQFTYYYVYDNNEESRLAPVSIVDWWTTLLKIRIPDDEFNTYLNGIDIVKQVVFCFRIGNDGVWYTIKRVDNISANYVSGGLQYLIPNVQLIAKSIVSSDITDADFDSVPLKSVSNEVAQNRIDHGNYLIDYDTWDGLTLSLETELLPLNIVYNQQWRTFTPKASINVGITLKDEWGRKIGIVESQLVQIPESEYYQRDVFTNPPTSDYPGVFQTTNLQYVINWTLTGTFPEWAKYCEISYSKPLNITYYNPSVCQVLYWYIKDGVNYYSQYALSNTIANVFFEDPALVLKGNYLFMGFAVQLSAGEPFLYNSSADVEQRVTIYDGYTNSNTGKTAKVYDAKITGKDGNFLLVKYDVNQVELIPSYPSITLDDFPFVFPTFIPYLFQVSLYEVTTSPSEFYYQTTQIFEITDQTIGTPLTGTLTGDSYVNKFKKVVNGGVVSVLYARPGCAITSLLPCNVWGVLQNDAINPYTTNQYQVEGYFISMNPTNIYSQIWSSDIGQPNVVNENQRQKRIENGIIFSNPLIQGTQINGLSKFNSVDNRQAPLENGPITALVRTNATQREPGVLLAIGKNGVSSFYYDGIQLTNIDGTSNVSTSDKYLASQRPLVGNYGADRLRDICVTPLGTVYYWSQGIRDLIRYTNAGLEQLGETYQFMNYLRNQLESSTRFMITYDQVTDEVILVGNDANAYVFSERYKTFQGAREYYDADGIRPERGATLSTRTFFFKQGQIWQMGPQLSAQNNSFFGEVKNPELTIVTNEMPTISKQWNNIKIIGPRPITTTMTTEVISQLADGRLVSYIDEGWWINRKGDWDAAIRRDTINEGGVMNGKIMESRILITTFAWDANTFGKVNYIQVQSNKSIVQ